MTVGTVGAGGGAGGGVGRGGVVVHAASVRQASASSAPLECRAMWLIVLEALLALALLLFIVWWTMFHKPRRGDSGRNDDGPPSRGD